MISYTPKGIQRQLNKKLRPMISITFDDGYDSDYNIVRPILEDYGFKGTFFPIVDRIGTSSSFMDENQIKEMSDMGHEIGSHTYSHPRLVEISDEEIKYELRESKIALQNIIGKPVETLCYPFGATDARVINYVSGYYKGARAIINSAERQSPYADNWNLNAVTPYGSDTDYSILAKSADPRTYQEFVDIIDDFLALEEPAYMTFMFHRIHTDDDDNRPNNRMNESLFRQCMEYLYQRKYNKEVDVVTFSEGLDRLKTARSIHL